MAIVYQHRKLDNNEIFYIGISHHLKRAFSKYERNKFWHNIVKKTAFQVEILHQGISYEEAIQIEISLISKYGRRDLNNGCLVNLTNGGEGVVGNKLSLETKIKMSEKRRGRIAWNRGKKFDNGQRGRKHSLETKMKITQKNLGRKMSQETKDKIRQASLRNGNIPPCAKGRKLSEETKNKMRQARLKYLYNNGTRP